MPRQREPIEIQLHDGAASRRCRRHAPERTLSRIDAISLGHRLLAAAVLRPPRAASPRRFVRFALAGLPPAADTGALQARCDEWRHASPGDPDGAARLLVAEDLGDLLPGLDQATQRIAAWTDPAAAVDLAIDACAARLGDLGLDAGRPRARVVERLPRPYDASFLSVISLDASDARAFGLPEGLVVSGARMAPLLTEAALGHVLVHVALGKLSPELLGRGLEEGVAEVLGGLHAASGAIGEEAADAVFVATRLTPWRPPHRLAFLDSTRAAAMLARQQGLDGLARLARGGRRAVRAAEAALAAGSPVSPGDVEREGSFAARLDRLLGRPARHEVDPLAFLLATRLEAGRRVADAGREMGLAADQALSASRELAGDAFVVVLSDEGEVLADDLAHVLSTRLLCYRLPQH